ncbi:hypothetical protein GCM10027425_33500 [Alteromonas gracilis]
MLPTVAPEAFLQTPLSTRNMACRPRLRAPSLDWTDPAQATVVAQVCVRCRCADSCLLAALRAHRAHLDDVSAHPGSPARRDGLYGVYGGVWFEPYRRPRRVVGAA